MDPSPRDLVLPQQLLLDIIHFCDIPTLKRLRLTHRSIRNLIDTYQILICSNASARFFENEELGDFQLLDSSRPLILRLFALEYRVKTAKWLAAVGAENRIEDDELCHTGIYGNIGAKEPQGDPIRAYLTVGFSVLWRLADIARKVISERVDVDISTSQQRIASLTRGLESVQKLETTIKQLQLDYISSLPFRGRQSYGYYIMQHIISSVFADRVFDDPKGRNSDWRTGNEYGHNNSWLNWIVLREGPGFFARAWSSKKGNEECTRLITTEWSRRPKEQLLIEHAAAKEVEESIRRRSNGLYETPRFFDLVQWASSGREIERTFPDVTFYLGRRLSKDFIKSIEYEYSDYSS